MSPKSSSWVIAWKDKKGMISPQGKPMQLGAALKCFCGSFFHHGYSPAVIPIPHDPNDNV